MNQQKIKLKWSLLFLAGAMFQMVCAVLLKTIFVEKQLNNIFFALVLLILGGMSTAIWGCIISIKSGKYNDLKSLFVDFFHVKANIKSYLFIVMIIFIIFGESIIQGKIIEGNTWYSFGVFFVIAILFGGVEEIGWRSVFQPNIEVVLPFWISSLCTFVCWGLWHYMYFYITDTINNISHISFLIGLLVSCFVLGAIYHTTKNLWLCVCYHALLNTFSQIYCGASVEYTCVTSIICIMIAIFMVRKKSGNLSN